MPSQTTFRRPSAAERLFNRVFGILLGLGLGFRHNYLLEVHGRKTGRLYATPVDLLEFGGKRYLVAPRGKTQWSRNAEAAGEIALKKGRRRHRFALRPLANEEKPEILKAYLDRFATAVQRYFPVAAGSSLEAFAPIAPNYRAYELLPLE